MSQVAPERQFFGGPSFLRRTWRVLALEWLTRQRLEFWALAILVFYVASSVVWVWQTFANGLIDPRGRPLGCDFIEFWTAAQAALHGNAAAIYDYHAFYPLEQLAVPDVPAKFPWHYPPTLLLLLLPFAFLTYLNGVAVWFGVGFLAYLTLAFRLARRRVAMWLGLAFPGLLLTLTYGQIGLLVAAALGWGLMLLDRRPRLAGALLALAAVKPHLVLLVPLALLASRRWTAFWTAAIVLAALVLGSWLAFGTETWLAFIDNVRFMRQGDIKEASTSLLETYQDWLIPWNKVPSVFVTVRLMGGDMALARIVQAGAALAAAAIVIWAWRGRAPLALKAAVLVTADFLVTPYFFDYDLILLALPIGWLGWHAHERGWLSGERLALLAAWAAPGLVSFLAVICHVQFGPIFTGVLLLALCRRIFHERRGPVAAEASAEAESDAARELAVDCTGSAIPLTMPRLNPDEAAPNQ